MRMRKIALFAKAEAVYGTAVALTGADAIRTHELKLTPFTAQTIERNLDGAAFGNGGVIHAGAHVECEFDVEMAGSGEAGTAPAYGPLLKACQMAEVVTAGTDVVYTPASNGTDSLTMYVQLDGQRHALKGARGTWSIKFDSQGIPYIHFKVVGLWVDPVTAADLAPDFTGFKTPRPVGFAHTPKVSLHGLDAVFKSFSYDHANDVQYFDNPGEEFVDIMDRKPAGSISLLAPTLATKNYFTIARADTTGALTLVHGMAAGNIVTLAAPTVQLLEPKYGDDKGRAMIDANLAFIYGVGDDEMSLTFT
jgi:hypothetical protein